MQPVVTVVMACYNAAPYLRAAIESVRAQTLSAWELVIVDDASTDASVEIARDYESLDSRIRVLPLPRNAGPAAARNAALAISQAPWIAILDADDVARPERLHRQLQFTDQAPADLQMVTTNFSTIDATGVTLSTYRYPTAHRALVRRLETLRGFPPHSGALYRATAVRSLDGFNPRFVQSEDWDLWLRLAERGQIAALREPMVLIRKHAHNVSSADAGRLQLRCGVAATVCHFLRMVGENDPSREASDAGWAEFESWIAGRLSEAGMYDQLRVREMVRRDVLRAGTRLRAAREVLSTLVRSGFALRLVREKLFGLQLGRQLAAEWRQRCAA